MAAQTPVHVSLLSKLLQYFELAASVGMVMPEPHVQAISGLIEALSADILKTSGKWQGAAPAPSPAIPSGILARSNVVPISQSVKSTF